jgi:hypothetical protein
MHSVDLGAEFSADPGLHVSTALLETSDGLILNRQATVCLGDPGVDCG